MRFRGIRISPGLLTFIVGLLLLALAGMVYQQSLLASGKLGAGQAAPAPADSAAAKPVYTCPMHPQIVQDHPGTCPICGMDLTLSESTSPQTGTTAATSPAKSEYTCPMHPQIVQDHPGTCPICGMELVPKTSSEAPVDEQVASAVSAVKLSPTQAVLGEVTAVHPSSEHMALTIPAQGETIIPMNQIESETSWTEGRVNQLYMRQSGGVLKAGDHIMDLYSEDLVQAQQEFLVAKQAVDQLGSSGYESIASSSRSLLDGARNKLVRLGMQEEQIKKLEGGGAVQDSVPIYARHGGVVMEKKVSEGMYVMKGDELFEVADLSKLWVELKVFEADAAKLKVGDKVEFESPIKPGKLYRGTIMLIEPELDMDTRTYRARVEVKNPDMSLRPGMILDAKISFDYGKLLLLPRNAVLHTGDGDLVYVLVGENLWEPRRVTVGRDFGDKVEIVSGLQADEAVAGTAVFLIDSEAQLKGVPRPVDEPAGDANGG